MQIVIKIPDHYYENNIKKELPIILSEDNIIAILPKGYGRLLILDGGSVEKYMFPMSFSCQKWISEVGISNSVVTIIEADKEEKQDEVT